MPVELRFQSIPQKKEMTAALGTGQDWGDCASFWFSSLQVQGEPWLEPWSLCQESPEERRAVAAGCGGLSKDPFHSPVHWGCRTQAPSAAPKGDILETAVGKGLPGQSHTLWQGSPAAMQSRTLAQTNEAAGVRQEGMAGTVVSKWAPDTDKKYSCVSAPVWSCEWEYRHGAAKSSNLVREAKNPYFYRKSDFQTLASFVFTRV